jgi:hypothetical protein
MPMISKSEIKQIVDDTTTFIAVNIRQIATLCLPILLATSIMGFTLASSYESTPNAIFVPFVFNLLVYPLYTVAMIQLMSAKARHENPTNSQLLMIALRQWPPFFLLKIMTVFLIFIGSFLILPGIWLWVRLSFAEFFLSIFNMSPKESIKKSMRSTQPYFWFLFLALLSTYIPILLTNILVEQWIISVTRSPIPIVLINTLWSFFGLFVLVLLFRIFMEIMNKDFSA